LPHEYAGVTNTIQYAGDIDMEKDLELLRLVRYALCTVKNTKLPYDGRAITKNLTTYDLCSRVEDRIKELEAAKIEQWTNIDTSIMVPVDLF
jgi:hypothetical protein